MKKNLYCINKKIFYNKYKNFKEEIKELKYILKKVDVARRAYESHMECLRSISSLLKAERLTSNYPNQDHKVKDTLEELDDEDDEEE